MIETCHFLALEDNANEAFFLERAFGKSNRRSTVSICRSVNDAKAYMLGTGAYADRTRFPVPHAVLTDLHLPPESGLDFVAWVRTQAAFSKLHVFVLSGSSNPSEIQEAIRRGANRVLMKPDQLPDLRELVEQLALEVCSSNP